MPMWQKQVSASDAVVSRALNLLLILHETVGDKIRRALTQKHPVVIVVGDDDVDNSTVGLRLYGEDRDTRGVSLIDATNQLVEMAQRPAV